CRGTEVGWCACAGVFGIFGEAVGDGACAGAAACFFGCVVTTSALSAESLALDPSRCICWMNGSLLLNVGDRRASWPFCPPGSSAGERTCQTGVAGGGGGVAGSGAAVVVGVVVGVPAGGGCCAAGCEAEAVDVGALWFIIFSVRGTDRPSTSTSITAPPIAIFFCLAALAAFR